MHASSTFPQRPGRVRTSSSSSGRAPARLWAPPRRAHHAIKAAAQAASSAKADDLKNKLLDSIGQLGAQAVLPGRAEDKQQVDALVRELKALAGTQLATAEAP